MSSGLKIDVDAELAKLKKSEGEAFGRFEQQPVPLEQLRDAKQAKQLFAQFDENADGKLDPKEVPDPLVEPIERLVRIADRDGDGKLTEEEFVSGNRAHREIPQARRSGGHAPPRADGAEAEEGRVDFGEEVTIRGRVASDLNAPRAIDY